MFIGFESHLPDQSIPLVENDLKSLYGDKKLHF
jgi:hypothetical protein